jgi:hypothetical protein
MKNKHSQLIKIAAHLARGRSITPIEALNRYGCFRLAARIHDLRKRGISIKQTKIHRNGKSYASYSCK